MDSFRFCSPWPFQRGHLHPEESSKRKSAKLWCPHQRYQDYQCLPELRKRKSNTVLDALLEARIPPRTIIAGDFNARHLSWQPRARTSGKRDIIADWIDRRRLQLLTEPDLPMHERGNALGLSIPNVPGA